MHDNRDDYGPIIADRRSREPLREDAQPLWRLVLALSGGVAVVVLLAWWIMGRPSSDGTSTTEQSESSAPEVLPEEHIEQAPTPPTRDLETKDESAEAPALPAQPTEPAVAPDPAAAAEQTPTPENIPEVVPDNSVQAPAPSAPVSVRFTSPDAQVRFELRGPLESSPPLTSQAGNVVAVAPGTYRVMASGSELETFEQEVTFDGARSYEYSV